MEIKNEFKKMNRKDWTVLAVGAVMVIYVICLFVAMYAGTTNLSKFAKYQDLCQRNIYHILINGNHTITVNNESTYVISESCSFQYNGTKYNVVVNSSGGYLNNKKLVCVRLFNDSIGDYTFEPCWLFGD